MLYEVITSWLVILGVVLWSPGAGAQGTIESKVVSSEAQRLELGVGKSKVSYNFV